MSMFKEYCKVDTHAHYIPESYLKAMEECFGENPDKFPIPAWSPEIHNAFMEAMGIGYSLVSVSSPHMNFGTPEYNAKLVRKCNDEGAALDSKKFGLMASLPLPDVESSIKEIRYCCEELKVVGFSLPTNTNGTYIVYPELEEVFAELNRHHALVTFHPNKPSAIPANVTPTLPIPMLEFFYDTTRVITEIILKGYAEKYPNIRYLMPHCGAFIGYVSDRLSSFKSVLVNLNTVDEKFDIENILSKFYYDLAGNTANKQFPNMRQIVGDDHFFYASDYPFTPISIIEEQWKAISQSPYMNDTLQRSICHENIERLLGRKLVNR